MAQFKTRPPAFVIMATHTDKVPDSYLRYAVDFTGDGNADYSFSDRDFNVRSLVGNAVLRWEYRPGSTLWPGSAVRKRHALEEKHPYRILSLVLRHISCLGHAGR